jgi:hypothetical protein
MMNVCGFFPADEDVARLRTLQGPLQIRGVLEPYWGAMGVDIFRDDGTPFFSVNVDYKSVQPLFELFCIKTLPWKPSDDPLLATVPVWDRLLCVYRTAWASPTTMDSGPRSACPADARAIGVTMAGLIFWDTSKDAPSGALLADEVKSCSIMFSTDREQIGTWLRQTDASPLADFAQTTADIDAWLRVRKTAAEGIPV